MPKKIIRVLQVGMSTNYGGTEAIVYEIFRHIDKTRIQFDFLNVYDEPLAKQEWLESMGARIFLLKLKRRKGYLKYLRGIKRFYREHAHEFDAVVCNVQCLDQIAMAKYAKKFGIQKTIIHLHNANYGVPPSGLARMAIAWNKRSCHRYVDLFLACSSLAAKWGFSKKDLRATLILKNGIPIEKMRFEEHKRNKFRQKYGFRDDVRVYGSAGRFDPQKNQEYLVSIYKEIKKLDSSARFVLLGRGPLEKEIAKCVENSGLKTECLVLNYVEDIGEFYSGIDAFLLPSLFEGLGMVLIEAQCSGLPCLATEKTIPDEAKISEAFQFVDLASGPAHWAEKAVEIGKPNRNEAYKAAVIGGRDINDTAREYANLFL